MKDNEGEIITSVEREYPRENIGSQQSERTENEQNEKNIETKTKKEKILKTKTKKDSKNDEQEEINRRWKKREVETKIPEYSEEAGPVTDIFENCQTANDFFDKFIEPIIDNIFFQTNLYAVQRNKVLNVNKEEFLAFFGINMLMGYHVLPSWRHYWSTSPDLGIPLVSSAMSRLKFDNILSNLHVNDNAQIPTNNKDKLYKLKPMIETLNSTFDAYYKGTRELSVDESMIAFKGRSSIKQYNPKKPIKRGCKIWTIADQKGYILQFDIYIYIYW